VTIPSGATSATVTINTNGVPASESVTITATRGAVSLPVLLTINAPVLVGISLAPTSVVGGTTSTGTVTLNGPAPTGGTVVSLSSSSAYATVQNTVTVAAGFTTGAFAVSTAADQSSKTATITASLGAISKTASLIINPPSLASFTLSPSTVSGGANSIGTVTLSGPAGAGGVGINLSSSSTSASVQIQVTVPAGATTATFVVTTTTVASAVSATITAAHGSVSLPQTLTIQAP